MNKFSLATAGIIVAALVTSVSVNAATDTTKTNVTPKGMSCQEFVDLNPQTMAPVAFWVLNEDEDFKATWRA
uniref:HdeA/HdeB family chaperone n=1 Tax=Salmonella enterica TaxID=28901 RepID=UPI001EFDADE8